MYLITGATGNVGSEVVEQLLARGETVRVFVRDTVKVAHWGDRVEIAVGDFRNPETFARALANIEAVFLMNGRSDPATIQELIAVTKPRTEQRLVFQSSLLANSDTSEIGQMHLQQEDAIRAAGWRGKFVRPGAFMTNAYQWISTIKAQGVVYNAMGAGRYAPVAPKDIAAVAVAALTKPDLTDEVLEVTGGEILSLPEQVKILANHLGRHIRCVDVPVEMAVQNLILAGLPPRVAASIGQSYATVRDGRAARITDTIAKLTGNAPTSFAEWACQHAAQFA
jgi:uncharacterized protein YbjT (DUF2867 family)